MSSLLVEPVRTWWQRRQFVRLPWNIYRGDPHWIPPLLGNQNEMLNYTHSPFYDDAEIQTFLAKRNGAVVGRIAAIINHAHNRRFQEQRGFFGFFECEDDQQTAVAMFDAVKQWLRERQMSAVRGPVNPSMNHECGLLVDGFDASPTFMNTYNPRYYSALVEGCGFHKAQDQYALHLRSSDLAEVVAKRADFVRQCQERLNVKLRPLDMRNFKADVRLFMETFNRAYQKVWGFVPLSSAEMDHLAKGFKALITPDLTTIAEVNGQAVAALLPLLDYNPRIKAINGRLFPFGFIRLLANRRAIKQIRVISAQVVPEFQRQGLGPILITQLLAAIQARGIEDVEFSTVIESNQLSYTTLRRIGAKITKTYRIYDSEL
ncbi:MAG TPA: N-acetyltransferase [Pirellulaceae bacterium]|jgi:ribosomal protein S18 acetylase RimI-like enzyme